MERVKQIQADLQNLYEEMRSTRVRDGLKMTTYLHFCDRLEKITRDLKDACEEALTVTVPPPPPPTM